MAGVPKAVCKDMMELYIVRISPPSRAVWIYMLQVTYVHCCNDNYTPVRCVVLFCCIVSPDYLEWSVH